MALRACSTDRARTAGFPDVYYDTGVGCSRDDDRRDAFTPDALSAAEGVSPRASFEQVTAHLDPSLDPVDQALYFEQRTFLHGLLVVEDKMSMAHSMEARVPLLDNELVDFSLRIPGRVARAPTEGKRLLLRQAARSFCPTCS